MLSPVGQETGDPVAGVWGDAHLQQLVMQQLQDDDVDGALKQDLSIRAGRVQMVQPQTDGTAH